MKKQKTRKLDIFKILASIDHRDLSAWDKLSDVEKSGFAYPVVLRWFSSAAKTDLQAFVLLLANEANIWLGDLYKYPELQYKLMAAVGGGVSMRRKWIPRPTSSKLSNITKLDDFFFKIYPFMNSDELKMICDITPPDDVRALAENLGMQDIEISDIVKLSKRYHKLRNK